MPNPNRHQTSTNPLTIEKPPDLDPARGFWRPARNVGSREETSIPPELTEQMAALGYLSGYHKAPSQSNVTIYDPTSACNGYNLMSSGHRAEAVLFDMNGTVLHSWAYDFWKAWPDYKMPQEITKHWELKGIDYWRRVYLYENGDLLGIYCGLGLVKVDKDSNLIWKYNSLCHHDLDVTEDGTIYVLGREAVIEPRISNEKYLVDDFIIILSPDGRELKRISIIDCFWNSTYASLLKTQPPRFDLFHTNTISVLDGAWEHLNPAFAKGNVLVSFRELNTIAIIDVNTQSIVWALSNLWHRQHQPVLLENGHMLVFDNRGYSGYSRVMEFDPLTQEIFWQYTGNPPESFYTEGSGTAQRLPNGNTLITESENGRAFEVTMDKKIVWEYISPYRVGEENQLIATLFEVYRLPATFPIDWASNFPPKNTENSSSPNNTSRLKK